MSVFSPSPSCARGPSFGANLNRSFPVGCRRRLSRLTAMRRSFAVTLGILRGKKARRGNDSPFQCQMPFPSLPRCAAPRPRALCTCVPSVRVISYLQIVNDRKQVNKQERAMRACRACAHLHADALSRVLSLCQNEPMPGREVRVRAKTPGGVWKEWREEEERSESRKERSERGRGRCGQAPVATANSGSTKETSGRRRGESFHSPSSRAADQEGRGAPALYRARSAPAGAGSSL